MEATRNISNITEILIDIVNNLEMYNKSHESLKLPPEEEQEKLNLFSPFISKACNKNTFTLGIFTRDLSKKYQAALTNAEDEKNKEFILVLGEASELVDTEVGKNYIAHLILTNIKGQKEKEVQYDA